MTKRGKCKRSAVELILFLVAGEKGKVMKTYSSCPRAKYQNKQNPPADQRHLLRRKFPSKVQRQILLPLCVQSQDFHSTPQYIFQPLSANRYSLTHLKCYTIYHLLARLFSFSITTDTLKNPNTSRENKERQVICFHDLLV